MTHKIINLKIYNFVLANFFEHLFLPSLFEKVLRVKDCKIKGYDNLMLIIRVVTKKVMS